MRRAILLFLKYPEPGRVKTRLAATVGASEAATIYSRLVAEVCRKLPNAGETIIVQFDPPERQSDVEQWLMQLMSNQNCRYVPQGTGNLGERLASAFAETFSAGFDQIAVIGSDCVEITLDIFSETWRLLEGADLVIGPTCDGGYYLLALRAPAPALFEDIAWSTDVVLEQTLVRAERAGLRVSLLRELSDVDTEDDWLRAEARMTA